MVLLGGGNYDRQWNDDRRGGNNKPYQHRDRDGQRPPYSKGGEGGEEGDDRGFDRGNRQR